VDFFKLLIARVLTQKSAAKVIVVIFIAIPRRFLSQIRSFARITLGACLTYIFVPQTNIEKQ
jgi:hypothetical protein